MRTTKTLIGLAGIIGAGGMAMGMASLGGEACSASASEAMGGRGDGPVIYVESQGLFYDSVVVADPVPPRGPFQALEMNAPGGGLSTPWGPGDREYVGGRWVEDVDGDGVNHYFVCPLLGPGRETP